MNDTRFSSFPLGTIVATPAALDRMERHGIHAIDLISRHARGDWGDLDPEDLAANEAALRHGGRLFSAYGLGDQKLWVITEPIVRRRRSCALATIRRSARVALAVAGCQAALFGREPPVQDLRETDAQVPRSAAS